MPPIFPFWFKQRQCKAEPADDENTLKVSGPNLGEWVIGIAQGDNKRWRAFLRAGGDGPEMASTEPEFDNPTYAWEAAFELFRTHSVV
jgi:hypothetical protein